MDKSVIILSSGELDVTLIMAAARIFGWNTLITDNLDSIQKLPQDGVAAILFDHNAVGGSWLEGTSRLRRIAPKVPLIVCHRITEALDWPAVCDAGAFHGVSIPLNESELRQSFGYVWAAMQRDASATTARPSVASRIRKTAA